LTIAWAFTGLIAVVAFPEIIAGHAVGSEDLKQASETLFGRAIQEFLGDGWRGLMIACLVAGVTSAETFMVVGSAIFTRNFYIHAVPRQTDRHYLWVGRIASAAMLALGILLAFHAGSVTQLLLSAACWEDRSGWASFGAAPIPRVCGPASQARCWFGAR
jgi:Na+/proline symporter